MRRFSNRNLQQATHRRALLESLLQQEGVLAADQKLKPRDSSQSQVASFAQKRLWFLSQLEPQGHTYNMHTALHLHGSLNSTALQQSFATIVQRHEVLRTSFQLTEGELFQVIVPALDIPLATIDLSGLAKPLREAKVRNWLISEACQPFDLMQGPLIRTTLLRLASDEHLLLLTLHHIVFDGWSSTILIRELASLYRSLTTHQPVQLPDLPIQYADFAIWQRQWMQGALRENQLAYWRSQLDKLPPPLSLPLDHPRPALLTSHGASEDLLIDVSITTALKALVQQHESTLFITLLAAFAVLLFHYSEQTDLIIGSPIANRTRTEIQDLIGFFVNTLPLRINLADNPTFLELAQAVRQICLEAYDHQDIPFEMLVEALQPVRNLNHTPLFQTFFVFQNVPITTLALPDLTVKWLQAPIQVATFDISLILMEVEEGLATSMVYKPDLFEATTIKRMLGHFQSLLEAIAADPLCRIRDINLLTTTERQILLDEWHATTPMYVSPPVQQPDIPSISALFEAQVARSPEAIAVTFGDQHLTYTELNQRVNQLADYLRMHRVHSDQIVALYVDRSVEWIVALLGILKVGAAYLPLDPAYPSERLAYMLRDSQVRILLTQQHLVGSLPEYEGQILVLDQEWSLGAELDSRGNTPPISPATLAYIIYTSGSTGKPKGVAIDRNALANRVIALAQSFKLGTGSRILQSVSPSFDAAAEEIFPTLISGATLVLHPTPLMLTATEFLAVCEQLRISVLHLPVAYWHYLMQEVQAKEQASLDMIELLIVGGESPDPAHVRLWSQLVRHPSRLINCYGPTEATITATLYSLEFTQIPYDTSNHLPIGRPLANTEVYVLDSSLHLVPIGVVGELYIGGISLARGYLNQPDLTAKRFVPHPWSKVPGARLYKTGDLVRYRSDGNLEFLGRIDRQIKLRGVRIELREIEAILRQHAEVHDAIVIARKDATGETDLVAYLVTSERSQRIIEEMRTLGKTYLPVAMQPVVFVLLDALPYTPNGKIDHSALPAPDMREAARPRSVVLPRGSIESQILRIWERFLAMRPISVTDNFFDIGGHSLLAASVVAHINQQFNQSLGVSTLFQHGTIEQIARMLQPAPQEVMWSPLIRLQSGTSRNPLFCVHPAGGGIFCYAELARQLGPTQTVYGLQAQGLDGQEVEHTRIEAMATYYTQAIRTVQPSGPYNLLGWSMGGIIAFEMAQQLVQCGETVELLALLDSYAPSSAVLANIDGEGQILADFMQDFVGKPTRTLLAALEGVESRDVSTQLTMMIAQAQAAGLLSDTIDPFHVQQRFHIFRTLVQAAHYYQPQPYPGDVVLLRAAEHVDDTHSPTLGWSHLVHKRIAVHIVPGNHYTMVKEPYVQLLVKVLKSYLSPA